MKTIWKLLGAALVVGLTPYKVEKDEETGGKSYQSLLWRITSAPGEGEKQVDIGINLGEGTLTSRLLNAAREEEPHLFSDELCVEYTSAPVTEEAPAEAEEPAAPAESAAPAEPGVEAGEAPEDKEEG